MIQYIYFVKCPNCEDEHFDFFDEAKDFALGCLSKKPVITQVEVNRNDFGECTDSADLGTVWSWEDIAGVTTDEPAVSVFTKGDFAEYTPDRDPEFDALDNSLDAIPDNFRKPIGVPIVEEDQVLATNKRGDFMIPASSGYGYTVFNQSNVRIGHIDSETDEDAIRRFELGDLDEECKKRPLPEGMTIEQLVEELEANEDTVECVCCNELYSKEECHHDEKHGWICPDCKDEVVECTWCEELYDKSECRYEVDLGWLCDRCQAAIMSRGETLTFKEGHYWDFLDEDLDLGLDFSNCVDSSDLEIWGVKPIKEATYKAILMKRFENVSTWDFDDTQEIHDEMLNIGGLFVFMFNKDGSPILSSWNPELLRSLGQCEILFDDLRYDAALEAHFNKVNKPFGEDLNVSKLKLDEIFSVKDMIELEYDNLTTDVVTKVHSATYWSPEETEEKEYTDSFVYEVDAEDIAVTLFENFLTDEDVAEVPGGFDALCEDNDLWKRFFETHLDNLVAKYYKQLLNYYEAAAVKAAQEEFQQRYDDYEPDDYHGESLETADADPLTETLEDEYEARLVACPNCNVKSFDNETGICISCGFN